MARDRAYIDKLRIDAAKVIESGESIDQLEGLTSSYSTFNTVMILFQKPHATKCAGFHDWRKAGRIVRKGATGAAIMVPLGSKTADDGTDKPIFSWRYVFDISDTEELTSSSPKRLKDLIEA